MEQIMFYMNMIQKGIGTLHIFKVIWRFIKPSKKKNNVLAAKKKSRRNKKPIPDYKKIYGVIKKESILFYKGFCIIKRI